MATKKDLIEAQNFSRNRLLSAFTGGAPGGKELEPAKPMRAVFGGVALSAMVIVAGLFVGLLQPGLPSGWEDNRLIVAKDTGARYISSEGVLYPVINTVSARMLIPADSFAVVSVNQSALSGIPIGGTVGILGGPDTLPKAADLDGTGWQACAAEAQTELWIGNQSRKAAPAGTGTVVTRDGETFVIADGNSYAIPAGQETAVLRAVGLDTVEPRVVLGDWLALFDRGGDLTPLSVPGAGEPLPGTYLPAGSVIHPTGSAENTRYLLTAAGELAPLDPLTHRLYLLGNGASGLGTPTDMTPSEIANLPTTNPAGGLKWPKDTLTPLEGSGAPCATLKGGKKDQRTVLSTESASGNGSATRSSEAAEKGFSVHIPENAGAIVRGGRSGTLTLIDSTATSYAIPGAVNEGVQRLGYKMTDVVAIPKDWINLLPAGPALTPEAAGASPSEP